MKNKKTIAIVSVCVCIVLIGAVIGITAFASVNKDVICKGVYIDTVDVSGMGQKAAAEAVEQHLETIGSRKITILMDENKAETKASELGITAEIEEAVTTALNIGKTGNFIKRYKDIKDLEKEALVLPLEYELDTELVKTFVKEECKPFNITAKNAKLTRENGVFVIKDHKLGRKVKVEDTVTKIASTLREGWDFEDIEIEAVVIDDEPEYTSENLAQCKDVLGTFSTTFNSSSSSRANNLANAAKLINGSIVWPGEIFSTGKAMQPITADNGYSMAAAYSNGQVVDSIGGGVCQVSTTLYNAILKAELEVTERSNHSMIVGYVKPSMDAAIAGDYKDLKVKNNTDVPIYIEATTIGRTITFTIYGHETRDLENRVVEYESKVLEVIQPGKEKVTEDKTKPPTYRMVTQSAHVGYRAELWKVVYENGVEVSRERVNYSNYAAEPAYVIVGTKKEEPKESEKPEESAEPEESKKPKPSKKPQESIAPEESEEPEVPEVPEVPSEEPSASPEPTPTEEMPEETLPAE